MSMSNPGLKPIKDFYVKTDDSPGEAVQRNSAVPFALPISNRPDYVSYFSSGRSRPFRGGGGKLHNICQCTEKASVFRLENECVHQSFERVVFIIFNE